MEERIKENCGIILTIEKESANFLLVPLFSRAPEDLLLKWPPIFHLTIRRNSIALFSAMPKRLRLTGSPFCVLRKAAGLVRFV